MDEELRNLNSIWLFRMPKVPRNSTPGAQIDFSSERRKFMKRVKMRETPELASEQSVSQYLPVMEACDTNRKGWGFAGFF